MVRIVAKHCQNSGSDNLVKYCPVPLTTANHGRNPENTRMNRIQVVNASKSQIEGQGTDMKSVMKCGIKTEILLDNEIQRDIFRKDESRTRKRESVITIGLRRGKDSWSRRKRASESESIAKPVKLICDCVVVTWKKRYSHIKSSVYLHLMSH